MMAYGIPKLFSSEVTRCYGPTWHPRSAAKRVLKSASSLAVTAAFILTSTAFAQPIQTVAQGADRGPAILVPTDVTGTQIMEADSGEGPSPEKRIKFEKFPAKFTCKKYLLQEETDTKCSALTDGTITLESGKILVSASDGRLLVRTKLADIAVPKDGIALIKFEQNKLSIFNLAGREFVVRFPEDGDATQKKSGHNECIGLDEGFGILSRTHIFTKESVASGILQYVGAKAASTVVIAIAMHDCQLAVIDPMRILQNDSILKYLTAEKWLGVLKKVEDTTERVGVWQKEENRR